MREAALRRLPAVRDGPRVSRRRARRRRVPRRSKRAAPARGALTAHEAARDERERERRAEDRQHREPDDAVDDSIPEAPSPPTSSRGASAPGGPSALLLVAALGASGMLFVHGVVGLSVLPILGASLALALVARGFVAAPAPPRRGGWFGSPRHSSPAGSPPHPTRGPSRTAGSRRRAASRTATSRSTVAWRGRAPHLVRRRLRTRVRTGARDRRREGRSGRGRGGCGPGRDFFCLVVDLPMNNEANLVFHRPPRPRSWPAGAPAALSRLRSRLGAPRTAAIRHGALFVAPPSHARSSASRSTARCDRDVHTPHVARRAQTLRVARG